MQRRFRISLPTHGLVELTAGLALVVVAFAASMGAVGAVLLFTAGVLLTGLGLGAAETISLSAHESLDRILAIALAGGAIVAALSGSGIAAAVLVAASATQLTLSGFTRWTRTPLTR